MPLYEYRCEVCGERFEVIQKFSDQPVATHDKCGGTVHRLLSAPALQFKGSGWYVTDYAKSSKPESAKAEGDGGAPKKEDSAPAKASSSESSGASSSSTSNATPSSDKSTSSNTKKPTTSSDTKNE